MDTVQRRNRLIGWLETIRNDVQDLILDQHVFWELQGIIDANPRFAQEPGLFNQWMASSFVQATAVGVRRQAKSGDDSISLKCFLQEVREYPSLVSREFYLTFFADAADWLKEIGDDHFDSIAGKDGGDLPPALLDDQIRRLETAVATIEHYVDRRIAHYDQRGLARPVPTFKGVLSAGLRTSPRAQSRPGFGQGRSPRNSWMPRSTHRSTLAWPAGVGMRCPQDWHS
jgi:hypothetical protein